MRIASKEKTNQYINETELKSLMIRINNKTFLDFLSKSFLRLDKYIQKYKTTDNEEFKCILEKYIIITSRSIMKNKKHQLLLIDDELVKKYREVIETKKLSSILKFMEPINNEIRIKNLNLRNIRKTDSIRIEKYIQKHTKSKSQKFKRLLKEHIIKISERRIIDKNSYERFGEMVLLIIKNILKKPKFGSYTYRDEFYSDSTDKILRYLKNFNHKLISKITGQEVNAFSYLSQYVHNSVVFIIKTKKTEKQDIEKYVNTYNENITLIYNESSYNKEEKTNIIEIKEIKDTLYSHIISIADSFSNYNNIKITYPEDYRISLEEYNKLTKLKELLNKQISVVRKRN